MFEGVAVMLKICNKRRGSAVGILLVAVAIIVYLVIPLAKGAFEMVYYSHIRERALAITDAAVFSALAEMDSEAYSEGRMLLSVEALKSGLRDAGGLIKVKNVELEQEGSFVSVSFEFDYPQVFSDRSGTLRMKAHYDLEMSEHPVY